jgi:hypothetical protein
MHSQDCGAVVFEPLAAAEPQCRLHDPAVHLFAREA